MKQRIVFILLTILLIQGCIPSLHSIVTDKTAVMDDRIIGTWYDTDPETITIKNSSVEIETDTDEDTAAIRLMLDEILGDRVEYEIQNIWIFERGPNVQINNINIESEDSAVVRHLEKQLDRIKNQHYTLTHHEISGGGDTTTTEAVVRMTNIQGHLLLDFSPKKSNLEFFTERFQPNFVRCHTFAKAVFNNGILEIHPLNAEYIDTLIREKRVRLKHEILADDNDIVLTAGTNELRAFLTKYINDPNLFDEAENLAAL